MQEMKSEFKDLSYKLRRIMCSPDDAQIQLKNNEPTNLDILIKTPMFYKISVEGKHPPGYLHIKYGPDQFLTNVRPPKTLTANARHTDLKVCYSA